MSNVKEILCLHHSHLDVGYTHPQNMLMELQCDYIDQAIDLCLQTSDWPEASRFRWTCEATYPLMKWFESAAQDRIQQFRRLAKEGVISVAALPMHTTPGCSTQQLTQALQQLDYIRRLTGCSITAAINHDVNGQPWTLSSLLLDSGILFYLTGINIHFGGIPFPRPYAFNWAAPDGRLLPTFIGEHYSLFSQFFFTDSGSTEKMHSGIQEYVKRMEDAGWSEDYLYLTATNPPLFDNNCPDACLADLIRRYNEEGHEQSIRFVTPEMLYERICKKGLTSLPQHAGDWTDYWNFGSASTARELKCNRRAKNNLFKADFLSCISSEACTRYDEITKKAYDNTILFDEHTWGSAESVSQPDQDETYAQLNHKKDYAYTASDLSAYVLGRHMDIAAGNPLQADRVDGIFLVNPTAFPIDQELQVPSSMLQPGRTLSAARIKEYLPYARNNPDLVSVGYTSIPPFTTKHIPFSSLQISKKAASANFHIEDTRIDTPFYTITLLKETGRIRQIKDKQTGRLLIDEASCWGFFELAEEHIDTRYAAAERSSIFPRNVDNGNRNISQWQHDWKAVRESVREFLDFHIEEKSMAIVLCYRFRSRSLTMLEQHITFSAIHPRIGLDAVLQKQPTTEPEGIYFTFPLALQENWDCVYDTADTFVHLDNEQLGSVCRDYITVDKGISLFDQSGGYTLACPDAPLVQIGDFQFGKENKSIPREKNPLLLAWPINNYWDTNFAISQEGKMSFHYELSTFTSFHAKEAWHVCMSATAPCILGASVICKEESAQTWLTCQGEASAPLFIRPQTGMNGWLVAVKNFENKKNICALSIPDKIITFAAVTDLQGNTQEELTIQENCITLLQLPNAITFLRISF